MIQHLFRVLYFFITLFSLHTMIVFPNCKINLGLHITAKRPDGYHNLETIFFPVYQLKDALEILPADAIRTKDPGFSEPVHFTMSGLPVDGDQANNLCIKAYHLLKNDFPHLPAIHMHLQKTIPMGAGLGGGSADGSFALRLLNDKFRLQITDEKLEAHALQLGSDCPFFIRNKTCYATGRGEIMEPVSLDLSGHQLLLINPGIHISTGWAFSHITPKQPAANLKDLIQQPIENWRNTITNDFQQVAVDAHPVIGTLVDKMYTKSAVYAAMSGTGSTVFGIFKNGTLPSENLYPEGLEIRVSL